MTRLEIERILRDTFSETTLVPLLDDYESMMKDFFLRKYDLVLISGGRFVETLFIILSTMTKNPVELEPNFTKIQKDLIGEDISASIRVIIPRAAKSIYDLRSRRGAVHVNPEVSPSYIDATLAVSIAQWILAEMIRVYSEREPEEISRLIQGLVDRKLPIVEEIAGVPIILETGVSAHDSILILLYSRYPDTISNKTLGNYLPEFTIQNILTSLRNAEKEKLVFRNVDANYLTSKGVNYIETKFGKRFFGGK